MESCRHPAMAMNAVNDKTYRGSDDSLQESWKSIERRLPHFGSASFVWLLRQLTYV